MVESIETRLSTELIERVFQKVLHGNELRFQKQALALSAEYLRLFAIEAIHRAALTAKADAENYGLKQIVLDSNHIQKLVSELKQDF